MLFQRIDEPRIVQILAAIDHKLSAVYLFSIKNVKGPILCFITKFPGHWSRWPGNNVEKRCVLVFAAKLQDLDMARAIF